MNVLNKQLLGEAVNKIWKDNFFRNSSIFFVGAFFASACNYLYQFLTARMLSVEDYGELQSVLAIFAITSILTSAIAVVLTKYAAGFKAQGGLDKIHYLFSFYTRRILVLEIIFFAFFALLSGAVAEFLNLTSVLPLIILGTTFLFTFPNSVNIGILQGLQKFKELSAISIVAVIIKVLSAVLLIKIGFGAVGAIAALVLADATAYLISLYPLKFLLARKKEPIEIKGIFKYSLPVILTLFFTIWLYNFDIILVKHFFPPHLAGEYGALATLGHIIFFITGPITSVMFSMAAHAHSNHAGSAKVFQKALWLVCFIGLAVLLSYFIMPGIIIKILIGSKFLVISKYLGWFGLSMFFYSLAGLFSQYFLCIGKTKCVYLMGIGIPLQAILIFAFHTSLWQIIAIMNGVMLAILLPLIFYYFKAYKYEKINFRGGSGL